LLVNVATKSAMHTADQMTIAQPIRRGVVIALAR
jgi:hypothetical protein